MPLKDPIKRKEYEHQRYLQPERRAQDLARRRADYVPRRRPQGVKTWFYEYKKTLSCIKCGESHTACLEFHHRDPTTKKFHIARFNSLKQSKGDLQAEMAKCDVLCANCHRKLHWPHWEEGSPNLLPTNPLQIKN